MALPFGTFTRNVLPCGIVVPRVSQSEDSTDYNHAGIVWWHYKSGKLIIVVVHAVAIRKSAGKLISNRVIAVSCQIVIFQIFNTSADPIKSCYFFVLVVRF